MEPTFIGMAMMSNFARNSAKKDYFPNEDIEDVWSE